MNRKIITTIGNGIKNSISGDYYKSIAYISFPKIRGEGYIKSPIGCHVNKRTILIDDNNLSIEDVGSYWLAVSGHERKDIINLLNEFSKLHQTTYELVKWDIFWDFIESLNK